MYGEDSFFLVKFRHVGDTALVCPRLPLPLLRLISLRQIACSEAVRAVHCPAAYRLSCAAILLCDLSRRAAQSVSFPISFAWGPFHVLSQNCSKHYEQILLS